MSLPPSLPLSSALSPARPNHPRCPRAYPAPWRPPASLAARFWTPFPYPLLFARNPTLLLFGNVGSRPSRLLSYPTSLPRGCPQAPPIGPPSSLLEPLLGHTLPAFLVADSSQPFFFFFNLTFLQIPTIWSFPPGLDGLPDFPGLLLNSFFRLPKAAPLSHLFRKPRVPPLC